MKFSPKEKFKILSNAPLKDFLNNDQIIQKIF